LQEKATNSSSRQPSQRTRAKPCASTPHSGYLLPGYTELAFDEGTLGDLIGQMERAQVGPPLGFQGKSGFDGTGYSLSRSMGFDTLVFSWWEDGPPEWRPLTGPALALIQYFKGLKPAQR
jgi:hypothetical protein